MGSPIRPSTAPKGSRGCDTHMARGTASAAGAVDAAAIGGYGCWRRTARTRRRLDHQSRASAGGSEGSVSRAQQSRATMVQ